MEKIKPNGSKERMDERLERMHKIECRNFNINGVSKIDGSYIPEIGCADGKVKPRTNYDRLISKSPEELAVLLEGCVCPRNPCPDIYINTQTDKAQCTACWLNWLKEEAEDES